MKGKVLLLIIIIIAAAATYYLTNPGTQPTISITQLYNVYQGQTVRVNVSLLDVSSVIEWAVSLKWDPHLLRVKDGDTNGWRRPTDGKYFNIYEGPFFSSISDSTMFVINTVSNTNGEIRRLYEQLINATATGSGVVATIEYECLNNGTTTIEVFSTDSLVRLEVSEPVETRHLTINGLVTEKTPSPTWTEHFQTQVLLGELTVLVATPVAISIVREARKPKAVKSEKEKKVEELFEED